MQLRFSGLFGALVLLQKFLQVVAAQRPFLEQLGLFINRLLQTLCRLVDFLLEKTLSLFELCDPLLPREDLRFQLLSHDLLSLEAVGLELLDFCLEAVGLLIAQTASLSQVLDLLLTSINLVLHLAAGSTGVLEVHHLLLELSLLLLQVLDFKVLLEQPSLQFRLFNREVLDALLQAKRFIKPVCVSCTWCGCRERGLKVRGRS